MIQSVRGTKDLLPGETEYWQFLQDTFRIVSESFGYGEIRTPVFEKTEVFSRGIGETTDVVNKEMYTFPDRKGKSLTLRPEKTASIARSVLQHGLHNNNSILRYWYFGQFFRYERPQDGRQRQFHQYGAECILSVYPESDIEIIQLADRITQHSGIKEYELLLNTLGSDNSRTKYRNALVEYFRSIENNLSNDSRNRLEINPLRILDSKDERDIEASKNAPVILDYLDEESKEHFDQVKKGLDNLGIKYTIQPNLVRGLDYYSHTVFELRCGELGAQDSFGGGGRYDGLFSQLGHKQKIPAIGFAMGVERILLALEKSGNLPVISFSPDIYIIVTDRKYQSFAGKVASILRDRKLKVVSDLNRKSFKAQLREANRLNIPYTVIIGDNEAARNSVQIKNMNDGSQSECKIDNLSNYDFY